MPLVNQMNTWAQAAGKGLSSNVGNGPSSSSNSDMEHEQDNSSSSSGKGGRMEEPVNETQIAAAYSEGWGMRGINQDTAWEVPSSPHLSPKESGNTASSNTSVWPPLSTSGTEIWESNVRQGNGKGVAKPPPSQMANKATSWNFTPTTHIGGTWGVLEEEPANVWTGVPPEGGGAVPGWNMDNSGNVPSNAGWNGPAQGSGGGGGSSSSSSDMSKNWAGQPLNPPGWEERPAMQLGMSLGPMGNDTKAMGDNGPDVGAHWLDPSWHNKPEMVRNFGNRSPAGKKLLPCGWETDTSVPPPPVPGHQNSGSNFDDGTAGWGNPTHQNKQVCLWKENQKQGMPPPGGVIRYPAQNKGRFGGRTWEEEEKSAFGGNFSEAQPPFWGAKAKGANTWADGQVDTSSWGGPLKQGGKPLTKDLIWASRQFRMLLEMNFKKDDIENVLRRHNMNLEEAFVELQTMRSKDQMLDMEGLNAMNLNQPRVHVPDDMNFHEHSLDSPMPPGNMYGGGGGGSVNFPGANAFSSGFNMAQNCKNQQNSFENNIAPNALGNIGSNNQALNFNLNNGINNLSPAMMRKLLQTQTSNPPCLPQNTSRMAQPNFSSNYSLRVLVQQIQMAVQAGHLTPNILQQPLAPQTLLLLGQLLQQLRVLQQLQQQQIYLNQEGMSAAPGKAGGPPLQLQISVQITQTKQLITNLQNQIAAQQAVFLKQLPMQQQQQQQQHQSLQNLQPSTFDIAKPSLEGANGLHADFRELSVKDPPHSRLTQWKMPPFDKDNPPPDQDFSRAPGPSKPSEMWPPPQGEGHAWADSIDPAAPESVAAAAMHSPDKEAGKENGSPPDPQQQPYNLNDLVPEFEPGKPWKGSSRVMKNFEDDPHVTPGSIAKSLLSLNTIKDSDVHVWNKPSLTSSTWTYSPPPNQAPSQPKGSWNNRPTDPGNQPWKGNQVPVNKTAQPPPGMGGRNKPANAANWMPGETGQQMWSTGASDWDKQSGSNFLVLKNLTPQIDGSTLKTLCLQHGPLQLFHLLLNHGIALIHYTTPAESEKARSALNNCVLSNTTILVDVPTDAEVKQYLQLSAAWGSDAATTSSSSSPSPSSSFGGKNGGGNWNSPGLSSTLWSFPELSSGSNPWPSQGQPGSEHEGQCIPSSLNSFLPGDLLGGGEPI